MTKKKKQAYSLDRPALFYPKDIGKTLVEIEVDVIETSKKNVLGRWYHSENDADLFLWSDENDNIIKQQIIFSGQVVEWNIIDGLKTGLIYENEEDLQKNLSQKEGISNIAQEKNKKIRYDHKPLNMAVIQARDIVKSIEEIQRNLKEQLHKNYESGIKLSDMSSQEISQKFGSHLSPHQSFLKEFFKKIKTWFE